MEDTRKGQVTHTAADIDEQFFVPALFAEWAPRVADAARIGPGQKVLDVACGTGVLAREAVSRVGRDSFVTGLDRNEGMLAVARRTSPGIDWRAGPAEALPFSDSTFNDLMLREARQDLDGFVQADAVVFPSSAHIMSAAKT